MSQKYLWLDSDVLTYLGNLDLRARGGTQNLDRLLQSDRKILITEKVYRPAKAVL